jgi:glycosyltransferase involved in cell wall biosynthesis
MNKILVFDSHPVQYRVPVWKSIEKIKPGALHVVYASDCSVRGHEDSGFGQFISWDEPMLEGYRNTILNCEKGEALSGWSSLTGKGIGQVLNKIKPEYVLLTGLNYRYDWLALWQSKKLNIPVFLRCETQDEASLRSKLKYNIRFVGYFVVYKWISKFLYIGELNKEHYLKHGVSIDKLFSATYATVDRFVELDLKTKNKWRLNCRTKSGIDESKLVIGFSGKLIPKKNPEILYETLKFLPRELLKNLCFYFLGSGELDETLKQRAIAVEKEFGIKSFFTGFVNQSEIASHYLAMDILVLPSRQLGETWGLVANEAMQAGCSVIVSDVVGCHKDFRNWERFRVFKEGSAIELAENIEELSKFTRNFSWAVEGLKKYSIDNIANSIVRLI